MSETAETHYVKADLQDYADVDNITVDADRHRSVSRKTLLCQALGKDESDVITVKEGGYQGTIVYVLRHADYVWLVKASYGSCSRCDGILAADKVSDYRSYAEGMLRNAYAFENTDDAVRFLHNREDDGHGGRTFAYGWGPLVDDAIFALNNL